MWAPLYLSDQRLSAHKDACLIACRWWSWAPDHAELRAPAPLRFVDGASGPHRIDVVIANGAPVVVG